MPEFRLDDFIFDVCCGFPLIVLIFAVLYVLIFNDLNPTWQEKSKLLDGLNSIKDELHETDAEKRERLAELEKLKLQTQEGWEHFLYVLRSFFLWCITEPIIRAPIIALGIYLIIRLVILITLATFSDATLFESTMQSRIGSFEQGNSIDYLVMKLAFIAAVTIDLLHLFLSRGVKTASQITVLVETFVVTKVLFLKTKWRILTLTIRTLVHSILILILLLIIYTPNINLRSNSELQKIENQLLDNGNAIVTNISMTLVSREDGGHFAANDHLANARVLIYERVLLVIGFNPISRNELINMLTLRGDIYETIEQDLEKIKSSIGFFENYFGWDKDYIYDTSHLIALLNPNESDSLFGDRILSVEQMLSGNIDEGNSWLDSLYWEYAYVSSDNMLTLNRKPISLFIFTVALILNILIIRSEKKL